MTDATLRSAGGSRRRRLTLVIGLVLLIGLGGVVIAREHWMGLRQGLHEMRLALAEARGEQQRMRLRVAAAEARLQQQLHLLGLERRGPVPAGPPAASLPSPAEPRPTAPEVSPARPDPVRLAAQLAAIADRLAAGGRAGDAAATLRRLGMELRAARYAPVADELDALAAALDASTRIDWSVVAARLDALLHAANHLPPPRVAAHREDAGPMPSRGAPPASSHVGSTARRRPGDQAGGFRRAMRAQLEVAAAALRLRDLALLRLSGAGAERLLRAHYPDGGEALLFAQRLRELRQAVKAMDRAAVTARIDALARVLAEPPADRTPSKVVSMPER